MPSTSRTTENVYARGYSNVQLDTNCVVEKPNCAVTFKENCEVMFDNVALHCFELAVNLQCSVCCMHTGVLGVMTSVVTRILCSRG